MNVRDPFGLHRPPAFNIVRGTAIQTAAQVTQRVKEAGVQAYESGRQAVEEMSFSVPRNIPSFSDPQRELENRVWGSSGVTARTVSHSNGVMGGMQDRVGNFFEKSRGDLPMYKDKPYSYAASRRRQPFWKRKRNMGGLAALFCLIILYYRGVFSSSPDVSEIDGKTKNNWRWLKGAEKAGKVDWMDRREKVKEAFTLSWDSYERYAWGMLLSDIPRSVTIGMNDC